MIKFILFSLLGLSLTGCTGRDQRSAQTGDLSQQLMGTWILETTDGHAVTSKEAGRLKFFTGSHWIITQADPKSGEVGFTHGGTYALQGDIVIQTVAYAKNNTMNLIGEAHKFRTRVDGNTLTQVGIGNRWTETWRRLR